jgi:hypothetical protein
MKLGVTESEFCRSLQKYPLPDVGASKPLASARSLRASANFTDRNCFKPGGNVKAFTKIFSYRRSLLKAIGFLCVALMNLVLPPYCGRFLALLSSVSLGYDAAAGPLARRDVVLADRRRPCRGNLWVFYNDFVDGF